MVNGPCKEQSVVARAELPDLVPKFAALWGGFPAPPPSDVWGGNLDGRRHYARSAP